MVTIHDLLFLAITQIVLVAHMNQKSFQKDMTQLKTVGSKRKVWINGELDNTYGDGSGNPAQLDFTGGDFSLGNIAEIIFFDERLSDEIF